MNIQAVMAQQRTKDDGNGGGGGGGFTPAYQDTVVVRTGAPMTANRDFRNVES